MKNTPTWVCRLFPIQLNHICYTPPYEFIYKNLPKKSVVYDNMDSKELRVLKKLIIGLVVGILIGTAGMAAAATTQTVQAALAKFTFSVDGQKQTLKNDPLVFKGSTYLPVRELSEMLGYELAFDNTVKTIALQSKGETTLTEPIESPAASAVATPSPVVAPSPTPVTLDKTKWILFSDFTGNYGILFGRVSNPSYEFALSRGNGTVEFSLPTQEGESIISTNKGDLKSYVIKGKVYLWIEDLKTLGLIQ